MRCTPSRTGTAACCTISPTWRCAGAVRRCPGSVQIVRGTQSRAARPDNGRRHETDGTRWPERKEAGVTTMATVMSAVAFDQFGGPEVLGLREVPMPSPAPGEVRIRVLAVSVGRTIDLETRAGKSAFASAIRLPHIPGAEHAGVVDLVGAEVTSFLPGQLVAVFPVITCQDCPACATGRTEACARMEIIGIHRAGAYALYSCVPAANVFPVTGALDAASAAALALNGAVALRQLAVAEAGHGTTVLVHGAGGALGLAVVRAALLRGARVIASARQPWKRERLRTLGADLAVDPDAAD